MNLMLYNAYFNQSKIKTLASLSSEKIVISPSLCLLIGILNEINTKPLNT